MKTSCRFCGIHFVDEFEKTLKPGCNYWGDKGMGNASNVFKKQCWDWVFSMPADSALGEDIMLTFDFAALPVTGKSMFVDMVPNWNDLTEDERKEFQRNYFKDLQKGMPLNAKKD